MVEVHQILKEFDIKEYMIRVEVLRNRLMLSKVEIAAEIGISYFTYVRMSDEGETAPAALRYITMVKIKSWVHEQEAKLAQLDDSITDMEIIDGNDFRSTGK